MAHYTVPGCNTESGQSQLLTQFEPIVPSEALNAAGYNLVALGHILDTHIIQNGSAVRTAVIFFYLSNEGISILENAARIGLPVPEKLKGVLAQLREEKGKE